MPGATTTETAFALEEFLPLWVIGVVGFGLLALSFWMARRDRTHADRPRFVWGLLVLRFIAILVLLWMLAGPTLITTLRKLRTKSIAVMVDTSASMGLVDGIDGSGNVSRWAAVRADHTETRQSRGLDEAAAALRAAQIQLKRFSKLPDATRETAAARELFSRSIDGLSRGLQQLEASATDVPLSAGEMKSRVAEAREIIEGLLGAFRDKSASFRLGKSLASLDREQWLPERLAQLTRAVGSLEEVADKRVKAIEMPLAKPVAGAAAPDSKLSRIRKVEEFISTADESWLKEIRKKAIVHAYEFGEKVVPQGSLESAKKRHANAPNAGLSPATQIGAAMQQLVLDNAAQPLEAAILITDGGHNAGRDPRELAPALAATTLHIVPIGNTKMQRDVVVHHTHAPKVVLQNDTVVIDSIVTAYDCDKETVQVELVAGDTVVDRQTVNVTSEVFDTRVQLRWRAEKLGKHNFNVRVLPVRAERTEENNVSKADIQVMEEKLRVLVADNFPRWETRYLLNLFKRDDRIAFDQLLFEPQPTAAAGARPSFPPTLDEWSKYRVVVLGDVLPSQLTARHQTLLREYVSDGGGNLIIVAGKDAMPAAYRQGPLAALLPVDPGDRALPPNQPFYLHVADEGSMTLATQIAENPGTSERLWREMSHRLPLYTLSEFSKPKPTTHPLIWASMSKTGFDSTDSRTRSFLAWHYVGAGRVVYLAAPLSYQLRYRQGDTLHHRFWGQLLRWAVARDLAEGSQTVRLSTDKPRYEEGEQVEISARLRQMDGKSVSGASLQVAALQEGNLIHELALEEDAGRPGSYHALIPRLPTGAVKLQLSGDRIKPLLAAENYSKPIETTIDIEPSGAVELRHPLCNLPLLREIADASGGMIVPPTGLKAAIEQLNLDPEVLETIRKKPLWNRWDLFCIFILCLSLEWAGRKYIGLA